MKPTRGGVMKNFNISCLDDFFIDDSMAIDNVLTVAERQMMIKHAIDNIKATEIERFIPGYENIPLYHGQSLINACMEEGLIVNMFSLRDTVESFVEANSNYERLIIENICCDSRNT